MYVQQSSIQPIKSCHSLQCHYCSFFSFFYVDSPSGLSLFDHLRSVFLLFYNISIQQYFLLDGVEEVAANLLFFIFWFLIFWCDSSYDRNEIFWVQTGHIFVPPLLHLLPSRKRKQREIWNIFLVCKYIPSYCIGPTSPCLIYWTCVNCKQYGNKLSSPPLAGIQTRDCPLQMARTNALDRLATMPASIIAS